MKNSPLASLAASAPHNVPSLAQSMYKFAARVVRALDRWGHRIGEAEIRRRIGSTRLHDLRELDDRLLRDIGIAPEQARPAHPFRQHD